MVYEQNQCRRTWKVSKGNPSPVTASARRFGRARFDELPSLLASVPPSGWVSHVLDFLRSETSLSFRSTYLWQRSTSAGNVWTRRYRSSRQRRRLIGRIVRHLRALPRLVT